MWKPKKRIVRVSLLNYVIAFIHLFGGRCHSMWRSKDNLGESVRSYMWVPGMKLRPPSLVIGVLSP